MKMEIPVLAEAPGTLTKLAVAEGDVVETGMPACSGSTGESGCCSLTPPPCFRSSRPDVRAVDLRATRRLVTKLAERGLRPALPLSGQDRLRRCL